MYKFLSVIRVLGFWSDPLATKFSMFTKQYDIGTYYREVQCLKVTKEKGLATFRVPPPYAGVPC